MSGELYGLSHPPQVITSGSGRGTGIGDLDDIAGEIAGALSTLDDLIPIRSFVNAILETLASGNPGPIIDWIKTAPGDWLAAGTDFVLGIAADFRSLLEALGGQYTGDDEILKGIQSIAGTFRSVLNGVIPIGLLAPTTPNLLPNAHFDGAVSIVEGDGWTHDPEVGRNSAGAARYDCTGVAGMQLSTPIQVSEGQKVAAEVWTRWAGVTSASGAGIRLMYRWYSGDTLVSTTQIAAITEPGTSGGWSKLAAAAIPAPAGVDSVCLALVVDAGLSTGEVWFDDASLTKPTTSLPQQWITGLLDDLGDLGDGIAGAITWIKDLIERLTGRARTTITDAIEDITEFASQLGTILSGGHVQTPLPSLVGATISTIRTMIEQIASIAKGDPITAINATVQAFKDGWTGITGQISNAISNAVDAAVDAIIDGMNGIGSFANAIAQAIRSAINEVIGAIFGDGGTKWGQELYVAAGPVTTGFNDVPLGFGMPFSGKITDVELYSSDHIGTGSIKIETRRNGTVIHTITWPGGNNRYTGSSGLNLTVAKGDRMTFYVTEATSQAANMSVSVMGKYV